MKNKLKSIISIIAISVFLFHCQNDAEEPNPYIAATCSSRVPGFVHVKFQKGVTLKQAQSYGNSNSDGIASVSTWFLTNISSDSAAFITEYIRNSKYQDNSASVVGYHDYNTGKASLSLTTTNLLISKIKLNAILYKWNQLLKDAVIKPTEMGYTSILLKIEEGSEKAWMDSHNKDAIVYGTEQKLSRGSCN